MTLRNANVTTLGIIAGGGNLPLIVCSEASDVGISTVVAAQRGFATPGLEEAADHYEEYEVGRLQSCIDFFKLHHVDEVVLCGQIDHAAMFKPELFDELMRSIISSGDNRAEAILGRITTAIEAQGLPVADLREYLGGHLAGSGVLTTSQPEQNLLGDLEFGLPIAREVVRLNIGQSVLIKDRVVIAVEAIEGTDGMIRRTAPLNLSAAVVIKLPLPSKDPRFDLPVIGSRTIESMKLAGAALLVIAAGQTIIIDPDKCIATADDAGISIIAVDDVTEMES